METPTTDAIIGCLLGTAVGDAIGLPAEGLSPQRQRRMFSNIDSHRLLFGRGMTSDDTEHTCLLANALIESAGDEAIFRRELARGLRAWLLTMPAGAGLATLRATIKLCLGVGPQRSGVFSAGNGPAMRSALIGVCYGQDQMRMRGLVSISTRITHTDPKAEHAALSVAIAAHQSRRGTATPSSFYEALCAHLDRSSSEYLKSVEGVVASVIAGASTAEYAEQVNRGRGPSGYCLQSVPVALHAWLRHPADYRAAVSEVVHCGGDTDTTAAIVGAIVGARVGPEGIPQEWRDGILDWPRSPKWITAQGSRLGEVVASGTRCERMGLPFLPLLLRNAVFAAVVIAHGLRRVLPPY
jgi:ADP-ribosylglycohydrolase